MRTFDQYRNGSVYLTQVFSCRVFNALSVRDNSFFVRSYVGGTARQDPEHAKLRQELADTLKRVRHQIPAKKRRQLAKIVVDAPTSYAGAKQTEANNNVDGMIRQLTK